MASEPRIVFGHRRKVRLLSGPDSLSWDQGESLEEELSVSVLPLQTEHCQPQLPSNTLRSKIPVRFLFQGHVYALDYIIYGKMIKLK